MKTQGEQVDCVIVWLGQDYISHDWPALQVIQAN